MSEPPTTELAWQGAVRIIRSIHPPIDLFEDIADPADWPALIAAEQKTNPRLAESLGKLDLVPAARRVSGAGATWLMAPFTHVSRDRPSRFTVGDFGLLYVARTFEVALFETMYHHARFMARTREPAGWTSQFREIVLDVRTSALDLRDAPEHWQALLDPDDYRAAQAFGAEVRASGAEAIAYPSVRYAGGECAALCFPDLASDPRQARHFDYHWNGERVDFYRDAGAQAVFRIV